MKNENRAAGAGLQPTTSRKTFCTVQTNVGRTKVLQAMISEYRIASFKG